VKYILVLQLVGSSQDDYDELIELEDVVTDLLGNKGTVDGHDMGSGQRNISFFTDNPWSAFETVRPAFFARGLMPSLKAGYREIDATEYDPLYPDDLMEFSIT
jgi:hypothetical protein